jgi:hypothetical protein
MMRVERRGERPAAAPGRPEADHIRTRRAAVVRQEVARTARTVAQYEAQFGAGVLASGLVLDVGSGDSALPVPVGRGPGGAGGPGVVRVDIGYGDDPPEQRAGAVAGSADALPFADASFDHTVSSWVTPHVAPEDVFAVLYEMIRVTKPGGKVMVHPTFHLLSRFTCQYPFVYEKRFVDAPGQGSTLVIDKVPGLDDPQWSEIAADVAGRAKLRPGRYVMSIRHRVQRHLITTTGTNRMGPTIAASLREVYGPRLAASRQRLQRVLGRGAG